MGFNINRYRDLSILDTLIAIFLTFPFTVMFWRGIWDLIGWYVFRNYTPWNYWFMVLIALLQMVGLMLLPSIQTFKNRPAFTNIKHAKNVEFWIVTRLFMYLHTLTYMFFWHGFWELQNHYLGTDWRFNLISLFTSYFALAMLNGCRSTMWPPMFISLDTPDVFYLASRFDSSVSKLCQSRGKWKSENFLSELRHTQKKRSIWKWSFMTILVYIHRKDLMKSFKWFNIYIIRSKITL